MNLTEAAAKIILNHARDGSAEGLRISFPQMQLPVVNVPYHIGSKIMATYMTTTGSLKIINEASSTAPNKVM